MFSRVCTLFYIRQYASKRRRHCALASVLHSPCPYLGLVPCVSRTSPRWWMVKFFQSPRLGSRSVALRGGAFCFSALTGEIRLFPRLRSVSTSNNRSVSGNMWQCHSTSKNQIYCGAMEWRPLRAVGPCDDTRMARYHLHSIVDSDSCSHQ